MAEKKTSVSIISWNEAAEHICASAARISTTEGDAVTIFEKQTEPEKDRRLIEKVLASGHESCVEHAVFTLAFNNVSVMVEQFMIEFRLASFMVKSRRYVDFSSMGYYVPKELSGKALDMYRHRTDELFSAYDYLVGQGIPKEDARFVLPYSFFSNFYCTVNARELCHIICEMLYGKGRGRSELYNIANMLTAELREKFPAVLEKLVYERERETDAPVHGEPLKHKCEVVRGRAELLFKDEMPVSKILAAYAFTHGYGSLGELSPEERCEVIKKSLASPRGRELEHASYSFMIRDMSLSGLTHLVRHRMQSIAVQPLSLALCGGFVLPESVTADKAYEEYYKSAFYETRSTVEGLRKMGVSEDALEYFCLSGNTLGVMTTMNVRELALFFKLRTCNRAQWEIRDIANVMLKQLKRTSPEIFSLMGPACYTTGKCPEGKLSCGKPYTRP